MRVSAQNMRKMKLFAEIWRTGNKHPGFSQSRQSDVNIVTAIRAERLQTQTKTTRQQPTFTIGKFEEISLGTLNKMIFQLFIEVRI